jgi:death on curing protein
MLLAAFGGAAGLRDENLLDAALARPRNLHAYEQPDLAALAAAYTAGIVGNHPFIDGNKRAGFLAAYVFLDRNGLELTAPEAEATTMTQALAAGEIDAAAYAAWLRKHLRKAGRS